MINSLGWSLNTGYTVIYLFIGKVLLECKDLHQTVCNLDSGLTFALPSTLWDILTKAEVLHGSTEPHSLVGSVQDLRTGGRWLDPWLSQYSLRGLMIVIATGFIPLSLLSVVLTMVMWESSHWLKKKYCAEYWLTHYHIVPHFDTLKTYSSGKNCEKK